MNDLHARLREHLGLQAATRAVTTVSMWPALAPGDAVLFRLSTDAPRIGEVWVAQRGSIDIAHRVIMVRGGAILLKGDLNLRPDGWFPRSALFGPVSEIQHRGRWRPANRLRDRALGLALSAAGSGLQAWRMVARKFAGLALGESRASALAASLRNLWPR